MKEQLIKIALVDDHELLRAGLVRIINKFENYKVILEAGNGRQFIDLLSQSEVPDIILLDISMPVMDGFETAKWIKENLPDSKILVLSMIDNETTIIRMINYGARGYILKDSKPAVLKSAFDSIYHDGYFSNDLVSSVQIHEVSSGDLLRNKIGITDRQKEFLKLVCSELTYKEIADRMGASPRTVDNYRERLFQKLEIKSRVGLALFAIREGFYSI